MFRAIAAAQKGNKFTGRRWATTIPREIPNRYFQRITQVEQPPPSESDAQSYRNEPGRSPRALRPRRTSATGRYSANPSRRPVLGVLLDQPPVEVTEGPAMMVPATDPVGWPWLLARIGCPCQWTATVGQDRMAKISWLHRLAPSVEQARLAKVVLQWES